MLSYIRVHPSDNVLVALRDLSAGEAVEGLEIVEAIPAGHKVAAVDLPRGASVIKYGQPIGRTTTDVARGQHVHSHNLQSDLQEDWSAYQRSPAPAQPKAARSASFEGYRRASGGVGVRNEVWIIPSVGCVNQASMRIAELANAKHPASENFDGVFAYPHPFGCSQLGGDLRNTQSILRGLIRHPNSAAVLIIGLGCENNQIKSLLEGAGDEAGGTGRVRYFNAQQVSDEIQSGLAVVEELIALAKRSHRATVPVSELIFAMKCGGSDGFSGITANPLVGRIADRLTQQGGTVLLSEVPEMFGAERLLLDRAADDATAQSIVQLVSDFRGYFRRYGQPIDENPSPGNKAGGLSTNADKSLGCVQKGGGAAVKQVLAYGEPVRPGGLGGIALVNAPGNDGVSSTAMTAAGAQVILFTTGRGTPMGFPVPTLKIASNSDLASRKPAWIDFDAGRVLGEPEGDAVADELFSLVLDVASGRRKARNEINGNREIAIWKDGVTL